MLEASRRRRPKSPTFFGGRGHAYRKLLIAAGVESVAGDAHELTNMSDDVAQTAERPTQPSDTLASSISARRELIVEARRTAQRAGRR
ncbi:MAG TPA: hypothetical protein VNT54_07685 [Solirubrobacteraceae bacterium]|nr:hypothetical protein [Solirubrobacteraceae bacterium]